MGYYTVTIKPNGIAIIKQQKSHVVLAPEFYEVRRLPIGGGLFAVYDSYGFKHNPYVKYLFNNSERAPIIMDDITVVKQNIDAIIDPFDELEQVGKWEMVSHYCALGEMDIETLRKWVFEPGKLEIKEE